MKQGAFEEVEELDPGTKERKMTGLKFTEDLGLVEDGNNAFGATGQNEEPAKKKHYDDAGCGEIRKEKKRYFSRQNSLPDYLKLSSRTPCISTCIAGH